MDSALSTNLLFGISLIILCSGVLADDTPSCKESTACRCLLTNGTVINLEPLSFSNSSARFRQRYEESAWMNYNPCNPFNAGEECKEAAACFQEEGQYTNVSHISLFGKQDTLEWKVEEKDHFTIAYKYSDRHFIVSLVCDENVDGNLNITSIKGSVIKAELTSKCACPGKCPVRDDPAKPSKHSISTGSIILILFFTLIILYLVGGIIYNKIVNGATGRELIPNVEFWTALPKLVLDGVAFTCNCCGKRKSTPGYDNV